MGILTRHIGRGGVLGAGIIFALGIYGIFGLESWILLQMIGCQPGSLASYTPQADLDVSYDSAVNEVAVWHRGGEALDTSGRLQSISITVMRPSSGESTGYTWIEAGGEYPIETGDSVTISSPTVGGESVTEGDAIRVVLHGKWHSKPMYCPNTKHRQLVAEIVVG